MNIEIARVFNKPTRFEGDEPSSVFEMDEEKTMRFEGPLCYNVVAEAIPGELVVRGRLVVKMAFRCSLCGDFFPKKVEEDDFSCVRSFNDMHEVVNLTEEMRESMILVFPSYPVCRPDCKGLCTQCGINRNTGTCSCRPPRENRWDALDSPEVREKIRR